MGCSFLLSISGQVEYTSHFLYFGELGFCWTFNCTLFTHIHNYSLQPSAPSAAIHTESCSDHFGGQGGGGLGQLQHSPFSTSQRVLNYLQRASPLSLSPQYARLAKHRKTDKETTWWREKEGKGWARSQTIWPQESLVLYKSCKTLCLPR